MTVVLGDFRFLLLSAGPATFNSWHTYDPTTNPILAELDVAQATLSWGLNRAGQASIEVSKDTLRNAKQNEVNLPLLPLIRHPNWGDTVPPGSTSLWVEYHGQPIWGGLVWELSSSSEASTVSIVAEEFIGYYDRLRLSAPIPANQAQNFVPTIVTQLLQNESVYSMQMPMVQGHPYWTNPFIMVGTTPAPAAFQLNTSLYTPLWYSWENHRVGDLVRSLQNINQGFDFHQGIRSIGTGGHEAVFVMNTPRAGYPRSQLAPASQELSWGEGTSMTAKRLDWNFSARQMANRIKASGRGERGQQLYASLQGKVNVNVGDAASSGNALNLDWGAPFLDMVYNDPQLPNFSACLVKARNLLESFRRPVPSLRFEVDFGATGLMLLPEVNPSIGFGVFDPPLGLGDLIRVHVRDAGLHIRPEMMPLRVDSMALRVDRRKNVTMLVDVTTLETPGV